MGTFERGDDVSRQFGATADNCQAMINPFAWPLTRFLRPTPATNSTRSIVARFDQGGSDRLLDQALHMTLDRHPRRTSGWRIERGMPQKTMLKTAIFCHVKVGTS
jgi:hypothetical protein